MESNRSKGTESVTEPIRKNRDFLAGYRVGYSCGRIDAHDEIYELDGYDVGYENGFEDGYDEGYDDAIEEILCEGLFEEEIEKPTDEESLLEFLDSLTLSEQRAALVHLSAKWAELGAETNNEQ